MELTYIIKHDFEVFFTTAAELVSIADACVIFLHFLPQTWRISNTFSGLKKPCLQGRAKSCELFHTIYGKIPKNSEGSFVNASRVSGTFVFSILSMCENEDLTPMRSDAKYNKRFTKAQHDKPRHDRFLHQPAKQDALVEGNQVEVDKLHCWPQLVIAHKDIPPVLQGNHAFS